MPLLTPHGKHLSIQNLLAISTMMSPFHHRDRSVPVIQAGGGHANSNIPDHQFYLSNAIQDHLKNVYQQHCGRELTLSREALVNFLQGTQVQAIEVPPEPATYGFEEFLKFLWSNHALDAMRAAAPKDLSRPISNYFISSSHNTYLSGNQLSSKSSTDAYKNVLLRGCRCIEIDVWNGEATVAESVSSSSGHKDHPERSQSLLEKVASKVENKVEKAEKKLDHAVELLEEKAGLAEKPTQISKEQAEATEARQRKALELERSSSQATIPTNVDHKPIIKEKDGKNNLPVAGNNNQPILNEKDGKAGLPVAGNSNKPTLNEKDGKAGLPVAGNNNKPIIKEDGKDSSPVVGNNNKPIIKEVGKDSPPPVAGNNNKPIIKEDGKDSSPVAGNDKPTIKEEEKNSPPVAEHNNNKPTLIEKDRKDSLSVAGNNNKPTIKEKDEKDSLPVTGNNDLQKIPSITSTDPHDDFKPPELHRAVPISMNPRSSTESLALHSRPSSRHSISSAASTRPEPRVLHGWTLTSEIGFRDVCRTVRETAFQTTDLPIIVSLEVHADLEQQEIMVDIMKEEWAGHLIDVPYESCDPEKRIPRLEELRNKILVKVKKATPEEPAKIEPVSTNKSLAPVSSVDSRVSDQSGSDDERSNKKKKTKAKICDSLSRLGIYTRSSHFTKFEAPEAKSPPHIFSVAEDKILELHETRQNDLFSHNRDFFMRAYPAGRRFDSSNLDPSVFWRKGVQMVALNWQTWDEAMMLNEGMFAGENGWVLKPRGYRSIDTATNQAEAINHMTLDLKIKIFAAQHIPLPPNEDKISGFHPYVKCELHVEKAEERLGLPIENGGKTKEGAHKQQSQTRKGIEPDWNGEQMVFYGIPDVVEELSFVRFKIQDDELYKDHLAAWACIRLDRLEQGYRFIRLFDAKGAATAGMLLVQVQKISRM